MDFLLRIETYWLCGIAGGLAHDILTFGGLSIGSYDAKCRILRLGFIGSAFLGILTAALADGSHVTAFVAAMAAPQGLEGLARQFTQRVYKRNNAG